MIKVININTGAIISAQEEYHPREPEFCDQRTFSGEVGKTAAQMREEWNERTLRPAISRNSAIGANAKATAEFLNRGMAEFKPYVVIDTGPFDIWTLSVEAIHG